MVSYGGKSILLAAGVCGMGLRSLEKPGGGVVLDGHSDDIDEDQHGDDRRDGTAAGSATALDGDGAHTDIGDQQHDFGQHPGLSGSGPQQYGKHDGGSQQYGVDDMGRDLHHLLLKHGAFAYGPIGANDKEQDTESGGCNVQVFDQQVIHIVGIVSLYIEGKLPARVSPCPT